MKLIPMISMACVLFVNTMAYADDLTQDDIDQLIKASPSILKILEEKTKTVPQEKAKMIGAAFYEGNPYQVYAQALAGETTMLAQIEEGATTNGYDSYGEFAVVADRVHSVLAVNTFMSASASFDKPEKIKNVYEYIELDSTPSDEKTRLTGYLPNMYERLNTNPNDVPIVSKNFDALYSIFVR